jgi:hypothetical protein
VDGGPDGGGFVDAEVGVEGMKVGGMGNDSKRSGTGCLRGRGSGGGGVVAISAAADIRKNT